MNREGLIGGHHLSVKTIEEEDLVTEGHSKESDALIRETIVASVGREEENQLPEMGLHSREEGAFKGMESVQIGTVLLENFQELLGRMGIPVLDLLFPMIEESLDFPIGLREKVKEKGVLADFRIGRDQ